MTGVFRKSLIALAIGLVAFTAGCQRKVEVETGTRVLCSYGHTISNEVKVVKVPTKEAVGYYVKTEVTTCEKHAQAEKLYLEAQQAIAKGDLKTAREKLKAVVALDSSFGSAKAQLSDIDAKKSPGVDSGDSSQGGASQDGSSGASGDDPAATPAGKLSEWTPAKLNGYTGARLVIDVFTVTRDYRPDTPGQVAIMVILAEQQRTSIGAKALMAKLVKQPCPYDASNFKLKGRDAYFGTDGRHICTLAFTEGPVMVALQASTVKEADPTKMKAHLMALAEQLP